MASAVARLTSAGVLALTLCTASVAGALPRADSLLAVPTKHDVNLAAASRPIEAGSPGPDDTMTQFTRSLLAKKTPRRKPAVDGALTPPSVTPVTRYMHGCDGSRFYEDAACACSASRRCTDLFGGESITIEAGVTLQLRLEGEAGQAAIVTILEGDISLPHASPVDGKREAYRVEVGDGTVASMTALRGQQAVVAIAFTGGVGAPRVLQTSTPLSPGEPVNNVNVALGAFVYYTFPLAAIMYNATITVTPISGDPDLYISLTSLMPNRTYYNYRSQSNSGSDIVTIRSSDPAFIANCAVAGCTANIGVYGFRLSTFSVVAITTGPGTNPSTALSPSIPQLVRLPAATNAYYTFVPSDTTFIVTFAVTPFSGDPDIYVSNSVVFPDPGNPSTYCAYSMTTGRDVVEIMPTSSCFCAVAGCTYYITVTPFGSVAAFYTILASTRTSVPIALVDGRSQVGFVAASETAQYIFTSAPMLGVQRRVVEFTLAPTLGDPDIYVNLGASAPPPTPTSYDYFSAGANGPDYVSILSSDPTYIAKCGSPSAACVFKITINAYTTSIFSLVATASSFLTLRDGTTVTDSVPTNGYTYYRFLASSATNNIIFSVTPLTGDPDLYITTSLNNTRASQNNYMWRSSGFGVEVITIRPTDPNACPPPCMYYLGVHGYRNSTFSIMARTESAAPTLLAINMPLTDSVNTGEYANYIIGFDPTLPTMTVTVLPITGDPDLYIRLDNLTVSTTSYQYRSFAVNGPEVINIRNTDPAYLNCTANGARCFVSIAVFGFSASQYTIIAAEGLTTLPDSVGVPGNVQGNRWNYYVYEMDVTLPATISVTVLSGDPDMYISVNATRPNASTAQWVSNGFGPEVVYILPTDPKLVWCISSTCRLYVGIYGWGGAASYVITAASSNMTTLPDTLPVAAYGLGWSMSYFVYTYPTGASNPAQGLEFIATPFAGSDVSLYISNRVDSNGNPLLPVFTTHPSSGGSWGVTNYQWTSFGSFSRERVTIATTDSNFVASGQYYVAVLVLNNEPAEFAVVGALLGNSVTLENGVPMQDAAVVGTYNYYRLINDVFNSDVRVTVTPLQGDPDLYVSVHSSVRYPNRTASDKRSAAGGSSVDSVIFQWSELTECQASIDPINGGECDIWIGVLGFSNTSYTIVATASNGTEVSMLLDGVPQTRSVPRGMYAYFYADVLVPAGQTYSVYVRPLSGDPDLYVRTDGVLPSNNNYQYASTHFSGDDFVNIAPGSVGYITSGRVSIAVFGFQNSTFQITFSTSAAVIQLSDGVSQAGAVVSGGANDIYVYYAFALSQPNVTVTIALTAISGDPDVFVGVWNSPSYRPTRVPTTYTWAGTAYGSDVVAIAANDPNACFNCQYIMAIFCAVGTNCRFSVTASTDADTSIIMLSDGQPLSNLVAAGYYRYFSFDIGADAASRNVTINVVSSMGDAQLYVTNTYVYGDVPFGNLPTKAPGYYIWSSVAAGGTVGSGTVTIAFNDPRVMPNATVYTIGVLGVYGPCSFTVTASSAAVPQSLVPGQPSTNHFVGQGNMQYYSVAVTDLTQDLLILTTVLSGQVALAVSAQNVMPTCTQTTPPVCNSTWTSATVGIGTLVRISAASPCTGPYVNPGIQCVPANDWRVGRYYIGVYAVTDTSYTITAVENPAFERLLDGQPQQGSTASSIPAIFDYQSSYNLRLPDVRISVSADDTPLIIYVNSCVESLCNAAARSPGPRNYEAVATVDASAQYDMFITKYSTAYCADAMSGSTCNYFIAVVPASACDPPCVATFTILASTLSSQQISMVTYPSITNNRLMLPGNIAQGSSALYEAYLQPIRPVSVSLTLEACGPGFPNVYVCVPNPQNGVTPCTNPFSPQSGAGGNTNTFPSAPSGTGFLQVTSIVSNTMFISVAADSSTSNSRLLRSEPVMTADTGVSAAAAAAEAAGLPLHLHTQQLAVRSSAEKLRMMPIVDAASQAVPANSRARRLQVPNANVWSYVLSISTAATAYLYPSSTGAITATTSGNTVTLSWDPALIGSEAGPSNGGVAAKNITYYVYAAPTGFAASGNAGPNGATTIIPTTACGLIRWSGITDMAATPVFAATSVTLANLQPNTAYDFNVVAQCDRWCWLANAASVQDAGLKAFTAAMAAEGKESVTMDDFGRLTESDGLGKLGAPGYNTQRAAYAVVSASTGAAPAAPVANGFPVAGIVGIVIGVLVLLVAGVAVWRYLRVKAVDHENQYASLDVSGAMDTISTPAYVRSSGGVMAAMRNMLSPPRPTASLNDDGGDGYGRVALADTGFSSIEDRAAGYL